MTVLALDLSSTVGWCAGPKPGRDGSVRFGSWRLGKTLAERFVGYENELLKAIIAHQPTLVLMEAPLPANRQASTHVARQQFGLAAVTEAVCYRQGVECREQRADDVRKAMLGRARFGASEETKRQVIRWCLARGWNVRDDHAADAAVLYAFCTEVLAGRLRFHID
jgi:Holliday junction resolvasome RuvABC endonuclease subunit